jgi:hypothetical protein
MPLYLPLVIFFFRAAKSMHLICKYPQNRSAIQGKINSGERMMSKVLKPGKA